MTNEIVQLKPEAKHFRRMPTGEEDVRMFAATPPVRHAAAADQPWLNWALIVHRKPKIRRCGAGQWQAARSGLSPGLRPGIVVAGVRCKPDG